MNNLNLRAKFYALVLLALIFTVSGERSRSRVYAQHEGHDMGDMPGMSKKPKPKSQTRKPAPQKTRQQATPQKDGTHDMHDMSMPAPSPTATPSPVPSPEPEASPAMEEMPGMQMPAVTPPQSAQPSASPQASPERMEMNKQAPTATPTPDAHQPKLHVRQEQPGEMDKMDMGGTENKAQPTGTKDSTSGMDMTGMIHPSGTGTMDPNSLMVMSGERMDIRVGSNTRNSIPMGQMGSGTSWQPATTPMHMWYKRANGWLLFFHGDMKLGVNSQGGPRGVTKVESTNWFMPMAFRRVGRGTLQLRGMFSLEPFTLPRGGTPELFQTGESYKGQPLIDKQHPHDLFMELSATYTVPTGERATWFTYFGYPGEPALGPVAFMHRWSASENPSAPLSHHLQDSTHITFGVFTTGFTYRWFRVEGSVFNGREPDENRYDFEAHPWNSHSVRFSFAPNENWALQWSYGVLKGPEALEPDVNQRRMTASVQYNKHFNRGNWASALIWGRNHLYGGGETANLNGYTFESTVNFLDKNYLYTRLELVDKNELLRSEDRARLGITEDHPSFRIGAYTFGGARDIWNTDKFSVALGGDMTFYSKPATLDPIYGKNPVSYKFFVRIRPSKMSMRGHNMGGMSGMGNMDSTGQQPKP